MRLIFIIYIIISGVGNDNDRINMARFLCTGESQPMGALHLPMMLICSKVPVASHLLRSLKVRFNPNICRNDKTVQSGRLGNRSKWLNMSGLTQNILYPKFLNYFMNYYCVKYVYKFYITNNLILDIMIYKVLFIKNTF